MNNIAVIVENRINVDKIIADHIRFLPGWEVDHIKSSVRSAADYNRLLTDYKFWNKYTSFDHVLIFQHDSGILRFGVEDFFGFSYVGAPWLKGSPWARHDEAGGNGGLSLRDPRKSRTLCLNKPYDPRFGNEDIYFSHYLSDVAPLSVCSKFSVETVYRLGTFGFHAIDKYLTDQEINNIKNQYLFT